MKKEGALIIRMGLGNTLLGFHTVHSYTAQPLSSLTQVLEMCKNDGMLLNHVNETNDWFLLNNGEVMVEIRCMVFGEELKGLE